MSHVSTKPDADVENAVKYAQETEPKDPLKHAEMADAPVSMGLSLTGSSWPEVIAALKQERVFMEIVAMGFVASFSYPTPSVARWVGFLLAAYSAVANDSVQTLGTFIASNRDTPWWKLWLWIAGVFAITTITSWFTYDGDVSYERLVSKGFEETPTEFQYLQVAAPVFLLILTRLRMPVSTTFLLLNCFVKKGSTLVKMVIKSLQGYALAFGVAIVLWGVAGPFMKKKFDETRPNNTHRAVQWISTAFLWSVWLQQDLANIAVFLPRSLSVPELLGFLVVIVAGLGVLFVQGGERIQKIVDEKSDVFDPRPAIVIDTAYGIILVVFKMMSKIPMSTTWVFIGFLTGRELALTGRGAGKEGRTFKTAVVLGCRDFMSIAVGFLISLLLAININPVLREKLF